MANVVITGVTSFLGAAVARAYGEDGHCVYGIVRKSSKNRKNIPSNVFVIDCDMDEVETLLEMDLPKMDVWIHFAWDGIGRVGRMDYALQEKNIQNALRAVKVSKNLGCGRFLFAGSQAEYGVTTRQRIEGLCDESTLCRPISAYGKAKKEVLERARKISKEIGLEYVHMRIFSVYGPGDHESALPMVVTRAAVLGEDIGLGPCQQMWNYLYIDDCARAIENLGLCVYGEGSCVVNVAGQDTRRLRSFVFEICKTCHSNGKVQFEQRKEPEEGVPYLEPSIEKLVEWTGFVEHTTFREGVREIEKMYRMRG